MSNERSILCDVCVGDTLPAGPVSSVVESPAPSSSGNQPGAAKRLEIRQHCGLGDAIILSPLFRVFLQRHRPAEVVVPVVEYGDVTVWHLYGQIAQELGAQLFVRRIPWRGGYLQYESRFWPDSVLETVGFTHPGFDPQHWDRSFYQQAGVDPDIRFSEFSLPSDVYGDANPVLARFNRRKNRRLRYVVLHECPEHGKRIPAKMVAQLERDGSRELVRVTNEGSLLWWVPIFEGADELFMVDSGPANLANSLKLRGPLNLFAFGLPPASMLNPGNRTNVHCCGTWRPKG